MFSFFGCLVLESQFIFFFMRSLDFGKEKKRKKEINGQVWEKFWFLSSLKNTIAIHINIFFNRIVPTVRFFYLKQPTEDF